MKKKLRNDVIAAGMAACTICFAFFIIGYAVAAHQYGISGVQTGENMTYSCRNATVTLEQVNSQPCDTYDSDLGCNSRDVIELCKQFGYTQLGMYFPRDSFINCKNSDSKWVAIPVAEG
jgi:hypothetical protein